MKKHLVDTLLYPYYYGTLPFRWWINARRKTTGDAPIIVVFYHRVADDHPNPWTISTRQFSRQIDWLRRHFMLVSLEEAQSRIRSCRNDRPVVSITFDDGYADNCEVALPLLIRHRIPFTYFVSVRHVRRGEAFAHDALMGRPLRTNTVEQVRAIATAGAEIGLHTRTHANLGRVADPDRLFDEVVTAGTDLANLIERPVRYFAFPYGLPQHLNRVAFQLAWDAGYLGVCSAYGGYNFPGDDPFHIRRFHADPVWIRWKNWLTVDPRKVPQQRTVRVPRSVCLDPGDGGLPPARCRPRAIRRATGEAPRGSFTQPMNNSWDVPTDEMSSQVAETPLLVVAGERPVPPLGGETPAVAQLEAGNTVPEAVATDSLAAGLVFMLTLTVGQRLIGFVRNILFCSFLQDDELGRWSLAFSFLLLAAPLAVAGLPGSFGRYVEYYRSRGQLGTFLRRTVFASIGLVALAVALLAWWGPFWAWLVLGDSSLVGTMRLLAITLVVFIAYNFVTELLTAMRKVRAVSIMQFVSSVLFAVLAIGLLLLSSLREEAVIVAFGISSLIAVLVVIGPLRGIRKEANESVVPLSHWGLWERLLPFATWVWLTNILANLFDAADRFMIVHLAKGGLASADSLVGQYHSSRVVPYLLIAISAMMAAVILPYLSHDWEAGDRPAVSRRQVLTLKLCGLVLTAVGGLMLLGAPLLFTWILRGKYDQGLAVLPWTLTYCIWFSLITIAQNYLWCAEKARLGTLSLLIGLIANLLLNVLLLPRFGLLGAIMATAAGNALALGLVLYFSRQQGLAVDRHVVLCCSLPAILVLGVWPALSAMLALAFFATRRSWILNSEEKQELLQVITHYACRLKSLWCRRRPASAR